MMEILFRRSWQKQHSQKSFLSNILRQTHASKNVGCTRKKKVSRKTFLFWEIYGGIKFDIWWVSGSVEPIKIIKNMQNLSWIIFKCASRDFYCFFNDLLTNTSLEVIFSIIIKQIKIFSELQSSSIKSTTNK